MEQVRSFLVSLSLSLSIESGELDKNEWTPYHFHQFSTSFPKSAILNGRLAPVLPIPFILSDRKSKSDGNGTFFLARKWAKSPGKVCFCKGALLPKA